MAADDRDPDGLWARRYARYAHHGCPGIQMEDNCERPDECAETGCRRLLEERQGLGVER